MKKLLISLLATMALPSFLFAGSWIRINQMGYVPSTQKCAVFISDETGNPGTFTVHEAKSGKARHYQWYPFVNLGHYYLATSQDDGKTTHGGLVDGPVYQRIFNNLRGLVLYRQDMYKDFQNGIAVYHDDLGDYSTNEPTMDGTASLSFYLSTMETMDNAEKKK